MNPTGAQIVVMTLEQLGTDTVFGYPGGWIIEVYDALLRCRGIRHVLTAHEQGAAHAADGYARRSGKVGVVMATSGPGGTNLVTGLAAAYMDSVPIVAITCGVPPEIFGRDNFQEVDISGITMPITKHNFLVRRVEDIQSSLCRAFEIASRGRPGPVVVDIHADLYRTTPCQPVARLAAPLRPQPSQQQVEAAAREINASQRPVILAGGGAAVSGARNQLKELSLRIGAPVCVTSRGLGCFDPDSKNYMGLLGMHGTAAAAAVCADADLIIAVGARFSDRTVGRSEAFAPSARVLHIDIDPAEIGKIKHADCAVESDAVAALDAILPLVNSKDNPPRAAALAALRLIREDMPVTATANPQQVLLALQQAAGSSAVLVTDVGQHQMWVWQYCKHTDSRRLITSCGLGAMGFGMGAAIGAKLASPADTVVLVTGDGSFHMNMAELATAVTQRLPIAVLLFDNGTLGLVRQFQKKFLNRRYSQTDITRKTDYIALAGAMGALACELDISDADGLASGIADALKRAAAKRLPVLIHCPVDREIDAYQRFGAKEAR